MSKSEAEMVPRSVHPLRAHAGDALRCRCIYGTILHAQEDES